ncbi:hypothetical protein OH799_18960 [Nocardia sp. NBC_00881]|uniref:hypothetical protein n=1 Tax=Nocardia sp. NBC_00881 TaxID=2975995 RepID=UPI0038708D11|nr:hypothetical protein OH799_18960 [Nocardia sp. NBC_00881]
MIRRFTTLSSAAAPPVDDLVAGALPDRVQIAHERLAHQDDPALLEALSERELAASRELAELVRDHERYEHRARIQAAADAAERVRRTAAALAEREAADLLRAAEAIGEQRRSSSPHAKVARLHQRKPRVLGLLAGVVAFSMLFSAVTVQQNIAPTGGIANPMWWLSYGLEALISAVLVALMLSTGDTAEWGVIDRLWQIYTVEGVLLTASIALNTFPYIKVGDVTGIGIHAIAPIMIGVALVTHRLVAERYGRAIEQATAAVPDHEDLQARLAALTQVGGAGNQILPSILTAQPTTAGRASEHSAGATEQPADAEKVSAEQALPVWHRADTVERERSTPAATAQRATAGTQIAASTADPAAAMSEQMITELVLATTPTPAAEPTFGGTPSGREESAEADAGEAHLDARLEAALRQTLAHIQISGQSPPVPPAERSDSVEHEWSAPASSAAEDKHVTRAETAEVHPESIARATREPISARADDDPALIARETDRAPRAVQNAPIAAEDTSPIARETGDTTPAATAPHADEPESAQVTAHPIADHKPSERGTDRARIAAHDLDYIGDDQVPITDDEPAAPSAVSPVWLTNRSAIARGSAVRRV